MNIRTQFFIAGSALLTAALSACSAYPTVERDFGNSVRQMQRLQALNTGVVDTAPIEGTDGERANAVLEAYRNDVTRPEQTSQPVTIDIGSGTGQ